LKECGVETYQGGAVPRGRSWLSNNRRWKSKRTRICTRDGTL